MSYSFMPMFLAMKPTFIPLPLGVKALGTPRSLTQHSGLVTVSEIWSDQQCGLEGKEL